MILNTFWVAIGSSLSVYEDHACIWYKSPQNLKHDIKRVWSLYNSDEGARSLEEIANYAKTRKFNCKETPLFSFIPLDHVIRHLKIPR